MTDLEKTGLALIIISNWQFSCVEGAIGSWFKLLLFLSGWLLFMFGGKKHNSGTGG